MSQISNSVKLRLLLQITQDINHNFSRDQLLKSLKRVLVNQLKIERLALYVVTPNSFNQEFIEGVDLDKAIINVEAFLKTSSNSEEIRKINDTDSSFFEYLIPVFHKDQPLAFLFIGTNNPKEEVSEGYAWIDKSDLEFIKTLCNVVFVALENKKLAKDAIYKEAMKKEIELAAEMQMMLFPSDIPLPDSIDVDAYYLAHQEVGGDYYDYFKLNDEEIMLCIADVSGKGISAALLMSNFQANVRALSPYIPDLEQLARKLNQKVEESAKGERFITAFIAKYNILTRILSYINCGHNSPILFSGQEFKLLNSGSIGLGMLGELPFVKSESVEVSKNAILVCFTDGLTEATDENGNFFGIERMYDIIKSNHYLSTSEINQQISNQLNKHTQDKKNSDDVALLTFKFK